MEHICNNKAFAAANFDKIRMKNDFFNCLELEYEKSVKNKKLISQAIFQEYFVFQKKKLEFSKN